MLFNTRKLRCRIDNDEVTVLGLINPDERFLTIPDVVAEMPVVKIADKAFLNCKDLTTCIIPNTLREIGVSAFEGCINFISINQLSTLNRYSIEIKNSAFCGCKNLTKVDFLIGNVGVCAFDGCKRILRISLSDGCNRVETHAFRNCEELVNVTIKKCNTNTSVELWNGCFEEAKLEELYTNVPLMFRNSVLSTIPFYTKVMFDESLNFGDFGYLGYEIFPRISEI